jgi:hypothetical protein
MSNQLIQELTDDGKVTKKILVEGTGDEVPKNG